MADILYGDNVWHRAGDRRPPLDGLVIVCSYPDLPRLQVWVAESRDAELPEQAYGWRVFPRDRNEGWLGRSDLGRFIPTSGRLWICIRGERWAGRVSGSLYPLAMIEPRDVSAETPWPSEEPSLLNDESIDGFMPIAVWERGNAFDPVGAGPTVIAPPRSPLPLRALSDKARLYVGFF